MKVTLLGCGTSVGVPAIGRAGWGACDPDDPRNRRQRCAVLVQTDTTNVLVDAGPDIRNQLLPLGLKKIDALLVTHTHSDHVAGLDDLRAFYWPDRVELPVHTTEQHARDIKTRFPYLFEKSPSSPSYFVPPMRLETIETGTTMNVGDLAIDIFHQDMGTPRLSVSCSIENLPIRPTLSDWPTRFLTRFTVCRFGSSRHCGIRHTSLTATMIRPSHGSTE